MDTELVTHYHYYQIGFQQECNGKQLCRYLNHVDKDAFYNAMKDF